MYIFTSVGCPLGDVSSFLVRMGEYARVCNIDTLCMVFNGGVVGEGATPPFFSVFKELL